MKYSPFPITDKMVCTFKGPLGVETTCQGDSGGPLVVVQDDQDRYQLAGILSWGIGCSEAHQPGVYSRVSKFLPWIRSVISEE